MSQTQQAPPTSTSLAQLKSNLPNQESNTVLVGLQILKAFSLFSALQLC